MRVVNDRRTTPRVTMRGDVRVHLRRGVMDCRCVDLSTSGMQVLSPKSVRPRHHATIETSFEGEALALSAVVVRRKRTREGYLIGLRFDGLEGRIQAKVDAIVRAMHYKLVLARQSGMFLDRLPALSLPPEDPQTERAPHVPAPPPSSLPAGPASHPPWAASGPYPSLATYGGEQPFPVIPVHPASSAPVEVHRASSAPVQTHHHVVSASASAYRPPSEPAPQAYRPPSDPHAADEPRAPGPTSPGRWDRTMLAPERWDSTMLISPPSSVPPFVGRASASSVPIEPAPRATSSPLVPLTAEDNWTDDELDTQSYRGRSTGRGRSPAPVQPRRLDYLETAAPFDPYQPVDDCHEQIVPPAVDEQLGPTEFEAVAGLYDAPVQPRSSD